jgi:hypothetical protein
MGCPCPKSFDGSSTWSTGHDHALPRSAGAAGEAWGWPERIAGCASVSAGGSPWWVWWGGRPLPGVETAPTAHVRPGGSCWGVHSGVVVGSDLRFCTSGGVVGVSPDIAELPDSGLVNWLRSRIGRDSRRKRLRLPSSLRTHRPWSAHLFRLHTLIRLLPTSGRRTRLDGFGGRPGTPEPPSGSRTGSRPRTGGPWGTTPCWRSRPLGPSGTGSQEVVPR